MDDVEESSEDECDKRWSWTGNGMMIANKIAEFNTWINEAHTLFTIRRSNLTLINLSGGIDAIIVSLWMLLQRQDNIGKEIKKIREKQQEQFVLSWLQSSTFSTKWRRKNKWRRDNCFYLASSLQGWSRIQCTTNKASCLVMRALEHKSWPISAVGSMIFLPTRPTSFVLPEIQDVESPRLLLQSPVNAKDNNTLWAQYFINRNNIETTDPNFYFPSIACQFADHSADVELSVHDALKRKPSLTDCISPDQAAELFVDSISVASKLYPDRPVVVVTVRCVCSLAILPDEIMLIIGCDDHSIRIVDLTSQEHCSLRFIGHMDWVMAVAVSPDGQHVASGSVDSQIHTALHGSSPIQPILCMCVEFLGAWEVEHDYKYEDEVHNTAY
ncbi:hypothetical protein C0995_000686 [Termitomyces sp. Mi166|nr:hypothetical protein C0995_000686 [Termitomyces sp. Mi166\